MRHKRPTCTCVFNGHELVIGGIGQLIAMLRAAQHRHEAVPLDKQLAQLIALGLQGQVAFLGLARALEDPELLGLACQLLSLRSGFLQTFEFGDIDGMLKDKLHDTLGIENQRELDAPVAFFRNRRLVRLDMGCRSAARAGSRSGPCGSPARTRPPPGLRWLDLSGMLPRPNVHAQRPTMSLNARCVLSR